MAQLIFEPLDAVRGGPTHDPMEVTRARVPGGWLVALTNGHIAGEYPGLAAPINATGITFVPDPEHRWTGASHNGGEATR